MADWDDEALTKLRVALYERDGAAGGALLKTRPLGPVLQYAGDLLRLAVQQRVPGVESHARRCLAELRDRDLPGDHELATELTAALDPADPAGEPAARLREVPVDLDELAGQLDGDPMGGTHVVDLSRGDVLPAGVLNGELTGEPEPAFDEQSEEYDPDRWLSFWPESRAGHRDMAEFAESVADETLRVRLHDALAGRGAFRRFRNVIWDTPEQRRWLLFKDERARGRARHWLAAEGYRALRPRL